MAFNLTLRPRALIAGRCAENAGPEFTESANCLTWEYTISTQEYLREQRCQRREGPVLQFQSYREATASGYNAEILASLEVGRRKSDRSELAIYNYRARRIAHTHPHPRHCGIDNSDACTGCVLMRTVADAQLGDADANIGCAFLPSLAITSPEKPRLR